MSQTFTHRNDGFTCLQCGAEVPAAQGTCRNHCTQCLHSRHVDVFPGDRALKCLGLMAPVDVIFKGGLPVSLRHECTQCGYSGVNKIAADDDREMIAQILEKKA